MRGVRVLGVGDILRGGGRFRVSMRENKRGVRCGYEYGDKVVIMGRDSMSGVKEREGS